MQVMAPRWMANVWRKRQPLNRNSEHSVLPNYGTVYLNHLIGEFESLKGQSNNDCACTLGQQIVDNARSGGVVTWGDTYVLERAVLVMLPDAEVHQRLWCLEARYRDAIGDSSAYDSYMKVDAPNLSPESIEHARARLDNLIRELYRLYTVIACREEMRSRLSDKAMGLAVALLVVVIAAIGLFRKVDSPLVPFAIVFMAGALGGAVSFERRVQSLPSRWGITGRFGGTLWRVRNISFAYYWWSVRNRLVPPVCSRARARIYFPEPGRAVWCSSIIV